mgnify:CR=1 FL=1
MHARTRTAPRAAQESTGQKRFYHMVGIMVSERAPGSRARTLVAATKVRVLPQLLSSDVPDRPAVYSDIIGDCSGRQGCVARTFLGPAPCKHFFAESP